MTSLSLSFIVCLRAFFLLQLLRHFTRFYLALTRLFICKSQHATLSRYFGQQYLINLYLSYLLRVFFATVAAATLGDEPAKLGALPDLCTQGKTQGSVFEYIFSARILM